MENLKILVCDDSEPIREGLVDLLGKCGVKNVFQLSDGCEVLDFLIKSFEKENLEIDLLITDYIMPKLDGLSLVREIREFHSSNKKLKKYIQKIPIIVATGEGETNSMISFVEAGVNNYLLKPCDKTTLIEKIGEILNCPTF